MKLHDSDWLGLWYKSRHLSQPFTCYWNKCRMAHSMPYPSSIVHVLSTCWFCTYTPSRAEEAVVTGMTGLGITGDWGWKKAKHPRRLILTRIQSWLCQPLYRSPLGPSLTEPKLQDKVVKKFKYLLAGYTGSLFSAILEEKLSGVYSGWQLGVGHWLGSQPWWWEGWVPWALHLALCQHGDCVLLSRGSGKGAQKNKSS